MAEENAVENAEAATDEVDYKALYEAEVAAHEADKAKYKGIARKQESKYKEAVKHDSSEELDELRGQVAELIDERNQLKAAKDRSDWASAAAAETGLPAEVIAALRGDSADELMANAKAVAAAQPKPQSYQPVGHGNGAKPTPMSKEAIMAIKDNKQRLAAIKENISLFTQ